MDFRWHRIGLIVFGTLSLLLLASQGRPQSSAEIASAEHENVRQRHAAACLELAELQLKKRLEANQRMPGLFPDKELHRYQVNVEVAKRHFAAVQLAEDAVDVHLQHASEQAKLAESDLSQALATNQAEPGTYSDYEISELRLKAEIANLRLIIWSHPKTNVLSVVDHLHWQLERVSEELIELQRRVDRLELK